MNKKSLEQDVLERFKNDIKNHEMTIFHDNGLTYRHIRFARRGTSNMHFDLITYPGYLVYSGDMGTFVFSRLQDMFEFFRHLDPDDYRIDFRYWAEKLQAVDKGGVERFSSEIFKDRVEDYFNEYAEGQNMPAAAQRELRKRIKEEVLPLALDSRDLAYQELRQLTYPEAGRRRDCIFEDFWEVDCSEYTYHFLWCCYALVWGIGQYDKLKQEATNDSGTDSTGTPGNADPQPA